MIISNENTIYSDKNSKNNNIMRKMLWRAKSAEDAENSEAMGISGGEESAIGQ